MIRKTTKERLRRWWYPDVDFGRRAPLEEVTPALAERIHSSMRSHLRASLSVDRELRELSKMSKSDFIAAMREVNREEVEAGRPLAVKGVTVLFDGVEIPITPLEEGFEYFDRLVAGELELPADILRGNDETNNEKG